MTQPQQGSLFDGFDDAAPAAPNEQEIHARIIQLRHEIDYHTHRYYALDDPEISDAAFDSLMRELQDLEREYPHVLARQRHDARGARSVDGSRRGGVGRAARAGVRAQD